jgi:methionyl-tRNA formyltransferase
VRIAFVGLPLAAVLLREDGHDIVWAGLCRKEALGTRRLTRALGRARIAIVPDLTRVTAEVRALGPDLVVSWFWTRKIPRAFRAIAPLGAIGVHPSLLPRHRGPDPYFWAIDVGDAVTGVTAHFLEDDYDTGAMLEHRELAIDPSWDAWRLARALDRPSLAVLRDVVAKMASGTPPKAVAQDEGNATSAPQPSDEDLELRWSWPAERIVRRIRAAAPWPGAFTEIAGTPVVVTRATVTDRFPRALLPGEATVRADGIAVVRAADAAIELHAGRLENDEEGGDLDAVGLSALVRHRPFA